MVRLFPIAADAYRCRHDFPSRRSSLADLVAGLPVRHNPPPPEPPPAEPPELDFGDDERLLAEMNRNNCVVNEGGRTWVLRFADNGGDLYRFKEPAFFRSTDFRLLYSNRFVAVGPNKKIDLGRWWLEHRNRLQRDGVIFAPAAPALINNRINLWQGWGIEPKPGHWPLTREHIFQIVAAGDDNVDRYVVNWLAWAVQHPDQQAETAIALIGERGSGKSTLGKIMCRMFGQHGRHISSPEHLTGRFNHHLRDCAFLFCDEAYGPKDKSAEGTFKRLVTEDTITIEQKGHDPVEQSNFLHVMLASNNDWVVPAGAFERHFVVLRVAETHRQTPVGLPRSMPSLKPAAWPPCCTTCSATI